MNHSGIFFTSRSMEEVFDLVADPQSFAPLFPDFDGMMLRDATHFTMRIAMTVGQISGHVNLAMELLEAVRPEHAEYRGHGIVAGSQLTFAMQFQLAPSETATQVTWQGEVSVEGMLALMAGGMIEELGRKNFELMAERLQNKLRGDIAARTGEFLDQGHVS